MKIISTNIGKPRVINWHGKEVKTGIFKYPVNKSIFLGTEDVEKDHVIDRRYHGGTDKACYLYSADHYVFWKKMYPNLEIPWGIFGENLTVEGLYEAQINIGDIYKIGKAVVQASQPRQPCFKLEFRFNSDVIVQQFIDSGFSGVYVRVLEKGNVKTGDLMELIERKNSLSVQKVYDLLYTSDFQKEAVEQAINDENLAESCRRDMLKHWGSYL
jgi:MOSC domain-containing protein YiiM